MAPRTKAKGKIDYDEAATDMEIASAAGALDPPRGGEPLHIKYRPRRTSDVVGQDDMLRSFEGMLAKGAQHAFLLSGPSGTGKTTLARIGAMTLGADDSGIREVDAATYTGIDAMRALTEGLAYKPLVGEVKVFIVDECHSLSKSAWQSLLKPLEEPPTHVYWFLCTTDVSKVPDTIKSRCAAYTLKAIDEDVLCGLLDEVLDAERVGVAKGVVELCAQEALGSARQALVNLGLCLDAEDRKEAVALLKAAPSEGPAGDLAKALVQGAKWGELSKILAAIRKENQNQESVRQTVKGYLTSCVLNAKSAADAGPFVEMLDNFTSPFYDTGYAQLVVAIAGCSLGA